MLSMEDIARKGRIGSGRVIVENFFGRVNRLFHIFSNKYRWSRDKFNLITDLCFSLTNFHVRIHPLREQDYEYYKKVLADLHKRTHEAKTKNKRRQLRHRQRKVRMELSFDEFRQNNDEELSNGDDDVPVYENVINEDNNDGFSYYEASEDDEEEDHCSEQLLEGPEDEEHCQNKRSNSQNNKRRRSNRMVD